MTGPKRIAERSVATFLFAGAAFSPPFLSIFGADVFVFGLPLLYLYLFAVWGLVIALVAWIAGSDAAPPPQGKGWPPHAKGGPAHAMGGPPGGRAWRA